MHISILEEYLKLQEKSFKISFEEAYKILNSFLEVLINDRGKVSNNFRRSKGLIYLNENIETLYVIGDLHGDIESLNLILTKIKNIGKDDVIVFLGDYVDRGYLSFETVFSIILLKIRFPENIIMLRGNHEPPINLKPYPHDFPYFLRLKFHDKWKDIYEIFMSIFQELPHAAYMRSKLFLVHGGIPVKEHSLEIIDKASLENYFSILEELLWNDPSDYVDYWVPSPRGAGMLFGIRVSREFTRKNKVIAVIRSHEPCNGYKLNHGGLVITIFSRKGPPYFNEKLGYGKFKIDKLNTIADVVRGLELLE